MLVYACLSVLEDYNYSAFTQPQHCIMALCNGSLSELGLQLLIDLLTLKDCSYWLVRTELLETLAEIDFR